MKGVPIPVPKGTDVLAYIETLFETLAIEPYEEKAHVMRLKKYINFIALGIEPEGNFLNNIRRTTSKKEFMAICKAHLDHQDLMPLEPLDIPMKPKDVLAGAHR